MQLLMQAVLSFEEAHEKAYLLSINIRQMIYICDIDLPLLKILCFDRIKANLTKYSFFIKQEFTMCHFKLKFST